MSHPVLVIGVSAAGAASLSAEVQARIAATDELWAARRLLPYWADLAADKVVIGADIRQRIAGLRDRGDRRITVLASGDPGFYGIAATIRSVLAPDEVEIIPHVSSLQLAFARIGEPWHDAILTSAHARPLAQIVGWARRAPKLGILTDPHNTPAHIAQTLLQAGIPDCRAVIAQDLGLATERISDIRLSAVTDRTFDPLSVMLVLQEAGWRPSPLYAPRPANAYAHRRGLVTKADVRALCLARLQLREDDVIWDIGAGSGAVSIEMSELAWRGAVYAIEHDTDNLAFMRQNVQDYGALNVQIIAGTAPDSLIDLPKPDAVFVGGTGGHMREILCRLERQAQPGCRLVITLALLENLTLALRLCEELGWQTQLTQASIAIGKEIAGKTRLAPLNPIFILDTCIGG